MSSKSIPDYELADRLVETGIPWNDPSGEVLREWLAMDRDTFLEADEAKVFGIIDEVFDKRPAPSEDVAQAA